MFTEEGAGFIVYIVERRNPSIVNNEHSLPTTSYKMNVENQQQDVVEELHHGFDSLIEGKVSNDLDKTTNVNDSEYSNELQVIIAKDIVELNDRHNIKYKVHRW
jgi:hypothetical protein